MTDEHAPDLSTLRQYLEGRTIVAVSPAPRNHAPKSAVELVLDDGRSVFITTDHEPSLLIDLIGPQA